MGGAATGRRTRGGGEGVRRIVARAQVERGDKVAVRLLQLLEPPITKGFADRALLHREQSRRCVGGGLAGGGQRVREEVRQVGPHQMVCGAHDEFDGRIRCEEAASDGGEGELLRRGHVTMQSLKEDARLS